MKLISWETQKSQDTVWKVPDIFLNYVGQEGKLIWLYSKLIFLFKNSYILNILNFILDKYELYNITSHYLWELENFYVIILQLVTVSLHAAKKILRLGREAGDIIGGKETWKAVYSEACLTADLALVNM